MADAKWLQVKEILDAAIRRKPEERAAFLDDACGGDDGVRSEIESLLSSFGRAGGFMESSPVEAETIRLETFSAGQTLGKYEIVSLIGKGGMGEVYLARDRQLRRRVALKVLPETVSSDRGRLIRFEQEAIAASSLNHPNIITIHEIDEADGARILVSEYIDGVTLREKIPSITVTDAIDVAIQTASALRAAHVHGIVHRDIKPENIMIREDGLVKVLDFGLAKLSEHDSILDPESETLAQVKTQPGTVMGTVTYMSPEQARGKPVDHRSDIWSLGVVLFEMLVGRPPFRGETAMDTIASILEKEPPTLPARSASDGTAEVISKALKKDVHDRYQTIDEMLADLGGVRERRGSSFIDRARPDDQRTEVLETNPTRPMRPRRESVPVLAIALVTLAVLGVGGSVYYVSSRPTISSRTSDPPARSPAYDLYMRGRVKARSDRPEEIEGAIKVLEDAVSVDPNFPESYAALAVAYNTKAFQFASDAEKKQIAENAEFAVEKALSLDPSSAEGHFARATVLWTHTKRFPHDLTIRAYKRALTIDPDHDEARHRLSMVYAHVGLLDEALLELRKALDVNPNNTIARFRVSVYLYYQGKFDEALTELKTVPGETSPALVNRVTADTLVHLGSTAEAETVVEAYLKSYPQDQGGNVTSVKAILFAKAGKHEDALRMIDRAIEIGRGYGHFHHTAYNIASAYAIMHNADEALRWLQETADDGFPCYSFFELDPNLDNLRTNRRFIDFLAKGKAQTERYRSLVNN